MEILPDLTNDKLMWTAVIGFLLPTVIAVVNQPRWSGPAKAVATILVSALVGAGTAYFNGAFTSRGIVSSILVVTVLAIGTYQAYWRPSGIAPAIERGSSGSSTPTRAH